MSIRTQNTRSIRRRARALRAAPGRRLPAALNPHAIPTLFAAIPSPDSDRKTRGEEHTHAHFDDVFGKGRLRMLDRMWRRSRRLGSSGLAIACALTLSSAVSAATLQVAGGQLFRASGVLVDGQLYDVAFMDGSCADLYSGCDELSDLVFQAEAAAILAGQALIDQVFLDIPGLGSFDTDPELTNGITYPSGGAALKPFALQGDGDV